MKQAHYIKAGMTLKITNRQRQSAKQWSDHNNSIGLHFFFSWIHSNDIYEHHVMLWRLNQVQLKSTLCLHVTNATISVSTAPLPDYTTEKICASAVSMTPASFFRSFSLSVKQALGFSSISQKSSFFSGQLIDLLSIAN